MLRFLILIISIGMASSVWSQDRRPSHCIALANTLPEMEYIQLANFSDPVPEYSVRLSYVDHSTFLLQTRGGISVATDYTGYLGVNSFYPTVVTMNHGHTSHWTQFVDPSIQHVLRGWGEFGQGIDHHLDLGEMLIRNISTDIRSFGGTEPKGNSIFVFEVEGLCIGHLGHLHHEPSPEQYAAIGRLDVVMAAFDGGRTLNVEAMIRVMKRLKSSLVIPMHWVGRGTLDHFLIGMEGEFLIERPAKSSVEVSLRTLPSRPTVLVLEPAIYFRDDE